MKNKCINSLKMRQENHMVNQIFPLPVRSQSSSNRVRFVLLFNKSTFHVEIFTKLYLLALVLYPKLFLKEFLLHSLPIFLLFSTFASNSLFFIYRSKKKKEENKSFEYLQIFLCHGVFCISPVNMSYCGRLRGDG